MSARILRCRRESGSIPVVLACLALATGYWPRSVEGAEDSQRSPQNSPKTGLGWFVHTWKPQDRLARGGDGLGPMFNARSCAECHNQGGIGGGGDNVHNVQILAAELTNFGRGRNPGEGLVKRVLQIHPGLKEQPAVILHRFGTSRRYENWRKVRFDQVPGSNIRAPSMELQAAGFASTADDDNSPLASVKPDTARRRFIAAISRTQPAMRNLDGINLRLTERNTSAIFGSGLIDNIPESVIHYQVERGRRTQQEVDVLGPHLPRVSVKRPETKGKVSILPDGRVGRFGWKAQHSTLAEFTQAACAVEVGLEVPEHKQGGDPQNVGYQSSGYDMNERDVEHLIAYVSSLPEPRQLVPDYLKPYKVPHGEAVFEQIGCQDCHVKSVGSVNGIYSDLLVHDMGGSFGDVGYYSMFVSEVFANSKKPARQPDPSKQVAATEWRTPPLWGVADSAPYMHDGRAATLEEAILAHEGTASWSAQQYQQLDSEDKDALHWFLRSLRAPTGEQLVNAIASAETRR